MIQDDLKLRSEEDAQCRMEVTKVTDSQYKSPLFLKPAQLKSFSLKVQTQFLQKLSETDS